MFLDVLRSASRTRGLRLTGPGLAFSTLLVTGWSVKAAEVLAIVPQVNEPYRAVLEQIVEGMSRTTTVRLVQVPPTGQPSGDDLSIHDEKAAVALGNTAILAAAAIQSRVPLVAGAIVTPIGQPPLPGISLETDPDALFKRLTDLLPTVSTVHWLYRPERSGWLLERAQAAAHAHKLTLVASAVDTAREAAQRYQEILGRADSKADAVWLSQDPALVGNDSALPDILGTAWTNNIVIFSGSVQHVAHGVLFALYPENKVMGENLARLALAQARGAEVGFEANRSVQSAINRRTAEHLGITPNLSGYDLVLPAR